MYVLLECVVGRDSEGVPVYELTTQFNENHSLEMLVPALT